MKKEEILKLIKEYQDYSKTNDYPKGEDEINQEELEVHEAVATSLREELEKNPDFFKEWTNLQIKEHIRNKHNEILNTKNSTLSIQIQKYITKIAITLLKMSYRDFF